MQGGVIPSWCASASVTPRFALRCCAHVAEFVALRAPTSLRTVARSERQGRGRDAVLDAGARVLSPNERCTDLRTVTLDMSQAYIRSVKTNAPQASIVPDHFHVQRLAHDPLDAVRRAIVAKHADRSQRRALKRTRFVQRNPETSKKESTAKPASSPADPPGFTPHRASSSCSSYAARYPRSRQCACFRFHAHSHVRRLSFPPSHQHRDRDDWLSVAA